MDDLENTDFFTIEYKKIILQIATEYKVINDIWRRQEKSINPNQQIKMAMIFDIGKDKRRYFVARLWM